MKGTNFPISPPTDATDIVHAAVIGRDGVPLAYIFVTQNGNAWYEDGPIATPWNHLYRPTPSQAKALMSAAGVPLRGGVGMGEFHPVTNVNLVGLVESGYDVARCY